jgi:hypothetical protein
MEVSNMGAKVVSPARSLKGWSPLKWFVGNWKTIKELLKLGIPLALGWAATNNEALTGLITIGGKFLLDVGEYYFKEYSQ